MRQAAPDGVRSATGQAIGGVSAVNWPDPLRVLIDDTRAVFDRIWSGCATPTAVVVTTHAELAPLTNAQLVSLLVCVVAPARRVALLQHKGET